MSGGAPSSPRSAAFAKAASSFRMHNRRILDSPRQSPRHSPRQSQSGTLRGPGTPATWAPGASSRYSTLRSGSMRVAPRTGGLLGAAATKRFNSSTSLHASVTTPHGSAYSPSSIRASPAGSPNDQRHRKMFDRVQTDPVRRRGSGMSGGSGGSIATHSSTRRMSNSSVRSTHSTLSVTRGSSSVIPVALQIKSLQLQLAKWRREAKSLRAENESQRRKRPIRRARSHADEHDTDTGSLRSSDLGSVDVPVLSIPDTPGAVRAKEVEEQLTSARNKLELTRAALDKQRKEAELARGTLAKRLLEEQDKRREVERLLRNEEAKRKQNIFQLDVAKSQLELVEMQLQQALKQGDELRNHVKAAGRRLISMSKVVEKVQRAMQKATGVRVRRLSYRSGTLPRLHTVAEVHQGDDGNGDDGD